MSQTLPTQVSAPDELPRKKTRRKAKSGSANRIFSKENSGTSMMDLQSGEKKQTRKMIDPMAYDHAQSIDPLVMATQADNGDVEIRLYGAIGAFGVSDSEFVEAIQRYDKPKKVTVIINSGGGSFYMSVAIFNELIKLRAAGTFVATHIIGVAASGAALIALAGQTRTIAENANYMIHGARGGVEGTSQDVRDYLTLLENADSSMAKTMALVTGKKPKAFLDLFAGGDEWYTANQAKAAGFMTGVVAISDVAPAIKSGSPVELYIGDIDQNTRAAANAAFQTLAAYADSDALPVAAMQLPPLPTAPQAPVAPAVHTPPAPVVPVNQTPQAPVAPAVSPIQGNPEMPIQAVAGAPPTSPAPAPAPAPAAPVAAAPVAAAPAAPVAAAPAPAAPVAAPAPAPAPVAAAPVAHVPAPVAPAPAPAPAPVAAAPVAHVPAPAAPAPAPAPVAAAPVAPVAAPVAAPAPAAPVAPVPVAAAPAAPAVAPPPIPAPIAGDGANAVDNMNAAMADTLLRNHHIQTQFTPFAGGYEIAAQAMREQWDDTRIADRVEVLRAQAQAAEAQAALALSQSQAGQHGGAFNIHSHAAPQAGLDAERALEAAFCLSMNMTPDQLLNPYADMSASDQLAVRMPSIDAFTEAEIDAATRHYEGIGIQEVILHYNRVENRDPSIAWRHDSSIEASYSSVTIPKFLTDCVNRAAIAGFRKAQPQWSKFARARSVRDFKSTRFYRIYATGAWDEVHCGDSLKHGELAVNESYEIKAGTIGQYFQICREHVINNDVGTIAQIAEQMAMYGRMAPEFAVFDRVSAKWFQTMNSFPWTFEALEALYRCFCNKTMFDPNDPLIRNKCKGRAMALDMEPGVLLVSKCREIDVWKLMKGMLECEIGDGVKSIGTNFFENMFTVCASSYISNTDGIALLPGPSVAPAIELAFLNGRQVPFVQQVMPEPDKLGFSLRGYLDVGVATTDDFLVCTADDLQYGAPSEPAPSAETGGRRRRKKKRPAGGARATGKAAKKKGVKRKATAKA